MISVTVQFDSFAGIAQTGTLYVEDTTTVVAGPVSATELSGNGGSYSVVLSVNEVTYAGDLLDFVAKDGDGNPLVRLAIICPATASTIEAKEKSEIRVIAALDGLDVNPTVVATISPYYLKGLNPPDNLSLKLRVGEIRDLSVNMFQADGTPLTEDDHTFTSFQVEVRFGVTIIEANITAALSGNVLTFRSTADMSAADRTLQIILWGNGPSPVHQELGSGHINVTS